MFVGPREEEEREKRKIERRRRKRREEEERGQRARELIVKFFVKYLCTLWGWTGGDSLYTED